MKARSLIGFAVAALLSAFTVWAQQSGVPSFGDWLASRPAAERPRRDPARPKRQYAGQGRWHSGRAHDDRDQRAWHLHVERGDDDSLVGRIGLVGSPTLTSAQIEGQISGKDVYGVLVDDAGMQVGTFDGTLANNRVNGTYQTADGDSGNWSWDGPPPE